MLRVWLPLTKDLRQQGLDNVTVTNNGATFNSAGKLGGCYEFASGKRIQTTLPSTSNLNSKAISFACWVNISSWNSSYDCLMSIADGTSWQQSRATLCRNNTASTLCWNIADGSTSTRVYTTTSLSTNIWYHIACTYDGASLKIYVNGTLNNSAAATLSIGYAGTFNIGGWSGNNYPINCKMNDVRVYSHCLSPMEVKELAKGLVLHYPLNRGGLGQENLFNWSNNATGITLNDYQNVGSFTQFTNSLSFDPSTTVGKKYTISFWAKSPNGTTSLLLYNSNSKPKYFNFSTTLTSNLGTEWQFFKYTVTNTQYTGSDASTNTNIWKRIEIYAPNKMKVQVKQIKVEEGSIATPWCPNSSDALATTMGLNSTTEYDCSGFCNNGTRTGAFTWTSDTPKYNISTVFNGSSCIDTNINYLGNEWSYGGWIYSATSSRSWEGVLMLNGTNPADADLQFGFYTCPKSNIIQNSANGKFNSSISWIYGAWHYFMGTYDGVTLKTYIDGVLVNSTGITQAFLERHNFVIGARHSSGTNHDCYFLGNISDVRIYATALSADDVKSLYQNSAYIDSSGNVYGAVHTEV